MATYVIGDIQGCFDPLIRLLEKINFNSEQDCLWLTGDLVNRGPASLEVLRFIKSLKNTQIVLGNHDLYFLSVFYGKKNLNQHTGLEPLLNAADNEELATWLRHKPLLHHDANLGVTLVHAGLPPQWDLEKALQCAYELEICLRSENYPDFFTHMYGDVPSRWDEALQGWDRLRVIANCLTRLRFCDTEGNLDLNTKGAIAKQGYYPWFKVPQRRSKKLKILFGHWAALRGKTDEPNAIALDTGCVWGHCLTAIRLEDWQRFTIDCPNFLNYIA
jgi:bis(5'-nucleosyl)-tetraphosphatase (symmetrical)